MKKQLEISLEKAREIYSKGDETMNSLLLEDGKFSKEELEKEEVKCLEYLERLGGWYVNTDSKIYQLTDNEPTIEDNKNTLTTKEQAEACLAMSQLSQLMKDVNGDWKPDWESSSYKYCLYFLSDVLHLKISVVENRFLAFPTEKIRNKFLENHKDLIMKARPLL